MFDNQSLIEQFGFKTENAVNLVIDVVYDVDSNIAGSIVYLIQARKPQML